MTKKEMAKGIADDLGIPVTTVLEIVQRTFAGITGTLATEGRIELRNFGVFQVKERKARKARNPRTGEQVLVPSKWAISFKPGLEMIEQVHEKHSAPSVERDASPAG
jgi:nucleoid DNA-binding protein